MLAHTFWFTYTGESTKTNKAAGWMSLNLPAPWACQGSSFMVGGPWKDATDLLQKLISQRNHHKQLRKKMLQICLPDLAWKCNSSFLLMLYLSKSQMNLQLPNCRKGIHGVLGTTQLCSKASHLNSCWAFSPQRQHFNIHAWLKQNPKN